MPRKKLTLEEQLKKKDQKIRELQGELRKELKEKNKLYPFEAIEDLEKQIREKMQKIAGLRKALKKEQKDHGKTFAELVQTRIARNEFELKAHNLERANEALERRKKELESEEKEQNAIIREYRVLMGTLV